MASLMASPSIANNKLLASSASFLALPNLGRTSSVSASPKTFRRVSVRASSSPLKENGVVSGITAAALVAALVIPDVAEAAQPGLSPSLKNFLLSIVAGGVVLTAIIGAVLAVANFDPVKRS